jgi:hypothetical protein
MLIMVIMDKLLRPLAARINALETTRWIPRGADHLDASFYIEA